MAKDLQDCADQVDGFDELGDAELVRFFSWFLHELRGQASFSTVDVNACFDSMHLRRPANTSALLRKMAGRGELLGSSKGYRLERVARQTLAGKYGTRVTTVHVVKLLADLPTRVSSVVERAYLDEALVCFRHGAFRSAIVMTWNLAFNHVCERILVSGLVDFNKALAVRHPKATPIAKRDDFADLKEYDVVELCRVANVLSKNVVDILREKLVKRNAAAHPSGVVVTQLAAESFISELVENVVLKV